MANSVGNVLGDNDVRKSFDALLVDALPDADLGSLGFGVHSGERSFNYSHSKGQSYKKDSSEMKLKDPLNALVDQLLIP